MTGKELLELAAKAHCGISSDGVGGFYDMERGAAWNSLTSDGDALRLAVKLGGILEILIAGPTTQVLRHDMLDQVLETNINDPYAATRRAITRAAAEIGKAMK